MKKFLTCLGITILVGVVAWTGLFFTVPQVHDWTLYDVLRYERVIDNETPKDETTDDTTGDENTESGENTEGEGSGDEVAPGDDSSILPDDGSGAVTPEDTTEGDGSDELETPNEQEKYKCQKDFYLA